MIKYIGSKRTLLPSLVEILKGFPELRTVADVFSGTSRVGHALKAAGYRVIANDHNAYAHCLATCYVATDLDKVEREARQLIAELNTLPGRPGYVTETFCTRARFFQPHNGARIDAIREAIEQKGLSGPLRAVLLTSLMEAADRVDSTCGLQMAYVKQWSARSYNELSLRMPNVLPAAAHGPCEAWQMDANAAVRQMDVDIAYIDPPYNQHSYLGNYHIWESLVLWDKPAVYGVAAKRIDCRTRKSAYNSKRVHRNAFDDLIRSVSAPLVVVSFNSEGYQSRQELEARLAPHGSLFVVTKDFKRYVGAQIGVFSPQGDRVGEVSHLNNHEYIYLLARPSLTGRVPDALERLEHLAARVSDDGAGRALAAGAGVGRATDRSARTTQALAELGSSSLSELQAATGLSTYQLAMALESLAGTGLLRSSGRGKSKRYTLATDA